MIIRNMQESDLKVLTQIHKQYQNEFNFLEFDSPNFIGLLVAEENNQIISAGGVRLIPEVILVTDKNKPVKVRRSALLSMLQALGYLTKRAGHDGLHAYIQDKEWLRHLLKYGFQETTGKSLVYKL